MLHSVGHLTLEAWRADWTEPRVLMPQGHVLKDVFCVRMEAEENGYRVNAPPYFPLQFVVT